MPRNTSKADGKAGGNKMPTAVYNAAGALLGIVLDPDTGGALRPRPATDLVEHRVRLDRRLPTGRVTAGLRRGRDVTERHPGTQPYGPLHRQSGPWLKVPPRCRSAASVARVPTRR